MIGREDAVAALLSFLSRDRLVTTDGAVIVEGRQLHIAIRVEHRLRT